MENLTSVSERPVRINRADVLAMSPPGWSAERSWRERVKRVFDVVVASALLVLLTPLFGAISCCVLRTGRPVFYRHPRIGRAGRPFECLKFRTMVPDADRVLADYLATHPDCRAEWRGQRKLRNDPRITRAGAWLRRTSLDELPQLINVLSGEMSLVGPRPVVESELALYGASKIYYLASTPGLTGLWQVSGRNHLNFQTRVLLDRWYCQRGSLWTDLVILLKTPAVVFRGHGAY